MGMTSFKEQLEILGNFERFRKHSTFSAARLNVLEVLYFAVKVRTRELLQVNDTLLRDNHKK